MVTLTWHHFLISHQLRWIRQSENNQCSSCLFFWRAFVWQSLPRPRKLGRHEGWAARGKQVPKGSYPPFFPLLSSPPAHFSASIYSSAEEKEGMVKGLYTPHSWKLIGLFTPTVPCVWESAVVGPSPLEISPFSQFQDLFVADLKALLGPDSHMLSASPKTVFSNQESQKALFILTRWWCPPLVSSWRQRRRVQEFEDYQHLERWLRSWV